MRFMCLVTRWRCYMSWSSTVSIQVVLIIGVNAVVV